MANINSNLNNLFKNYQQQQQYKKKAFDVNGDGRINSKDKTQLTNTEKNLLKNAKLFDFNNDGKLDQKDVDLFLKGDINQDGKVSAEEKNFVSAYKKELTTAFTKQKADFVIDGKKYVKGKLASGLVDGKYYKSGVLADGVVNGKQYVKGVLANGMYKNVLYKNGVKFTGTYTDNKYYKNGKVFTGTVNGANYKAGVLQYSVVDNNGKGYPNASGNSIRFQNGKKIVTMKLNIGEKAVINKDGTVAVTSKDGKTVKKYDKTGKLVAQTKINSGKVGNDKIILGEGKTVSADKAPVNIETQSGATVIGNPVTGEVYMVLDDGSFIGLQPGDSLTEGKDGTINVKTSGNNTFNAVLADGRSLNFDADGAPKEVKIYSQQDLKSIPIKGESNINLKSSDATIIQNPLSKDFYISLDDGTFISLPIGCSLEEADDGTLNIKARPGSNPMISSTSNRNVNIE